MVVAAANFCDFGAILGVIYVVWLEGRKKKNGPKPLISCINSQTTSLEAAESIDKVAICIDCADV